jgi:hypothetical protein
MITTTALQILAISILDVFIHLLTALLAFNAQRMTNVQLGLKNWVLASLFLVILHSINVSRKLFPVLHAIIHLLHAQLLANHLTNARPQHWLKQAILAHAKSLQFLVMMELIALLILAMQPLENANSFSLHLSQNALFNAKLLLNAVNTLLTTISLLTAKSLIVILNLDLAKLKMITRLIARNVNWIVNQAQTVMLLLAFGLEPNINANTIQRTAMTEKLALQIHAMQRLDNAYMFIHATLFNVTLTLTALLGDKLINFLPNA